MKPILWALIPVLGIAMAGDAQPPDLPGPAEQVINLLAAGDYPQAVDVCIQEIEKHPEDPAAGESLTTVLEYGVMNGQVGILEEGLRNWVDRGPGNALARSWLAAGIMTQPGREEEAETECQQALEADPNCPDAHFRRAVLQDLQGRADEAQAEWRRFLELELDSDRAWLVRRTLVPLRSVPLTKPNQLWMWGFDNGDKAAPPADTKQEANPLQRLWGVPRPNQYHPTWSPDGKQIACTMGGILTAVRVDTGELREICREPAPLQNMDWSPTGQHLLFTGATDNWQTQRLWLVDQVTGQNPWVLAEPKAAYGRWSPDGKTVIFEGDANLCTIPADGQDRAPVPGLRSIPVQWVDDQAALGQGQPPPPGLPVVIEVVQGMPSFTPEGLRVLSVGRPPLTEVFLWPFDGQGDGVQLTANGAANESPVMRPDGRVVLFSANVGEPWRHVRAVSVDEPRRDVPVFPAFFPTGWGVYPTWSPDGRRFAVDRPFPSHVWVVTLGGLDTRPVRLTARPQPGGLLVSLASQCDQVQAVTVTYRLFDPHSVLMAEGVGGEPHPALKPGAAMEFPLSLEAAQQPGTYTVKLTAVTDRGERVVELVDYTVK